MNPIDQLMNKAVAEGVFPSAVLLFAKEGILLHEAAYGDAELGTLFDVASLTKVFATTAIAMRLYDQGELDLEEPLARILLEFEESPYAEVTVAQLLAHQSGLPAYRPFFEQFNSQELDAESLVERQHKYLKWIAQEKPEAKPGEKYIYSDLDFITLGAVLEAETQQGLRSLMSNQVLAPLGLTQMQWAPVDKSLEGAALTEENQWRNRLLQGEVHDENAYVLGSAAGHAGLFATGADCYRFACEIISAAAGDSHWLSRDTVNRFVGCPPLGWDHPSRPQSQAGRFFPEQAIGHLGFTGCSLWIDLQDSITAILLSNRVHPSRDNEKIKEFRPQIHDALFEQYLL